MKLIDADRLKEVFRRNTGYDYADIIDMQPTVNALDKIRAEIDAQIDIHDTPFEIDNGMDASFCDGLNKAKEIIDKYREEQE